MEHPFKSRRLDLHLWNEALDLLEDAAKIIAASDSHLDLIRRRCDSQIGDEALRHAVRRNAFDMGRLLRGVSELFPVHLLSDAHHTAWVTRVMEGGADNPELTDQIGRLVAHARTEQSNIHPEEDDEGSSSYSDYSASDTASSERDSDAHSSMCTDDTE